MTAKIKLNAASGGGSISIQAPSSSSNNRVISLPDIADGTLVTSQSTLDATKLSGNLPAISGASLTGISTDTKFTHFRVNTGWSGGADPITNWDKLDNIGDLITESSGTFSFGQTGYYRVLMQIYCYHNADNDNIQMEITKTNNNSSYSTASRSYGHMNNDDGGNLYTMVQLNTTFDITDTTNMKVRFRSMNTSVNFHASAYHDESYAIFTRLGDT